MERAEGSKQSIFSSNEQRFAKQSASLGDRENASQSPANPSGAGRAHVDLAVGML